jgi:hypothetical protein
MDGYLRPGLGSCAEPVSIRNLGYQPLSDWDRRMANPEAQNLKGGEW